MTVSPVSVSGLKMGVNNGCSLILGVPVSDCIRARCEGVYRVVVSLVQTQFSSFSFHSFFFLFVKIDLTSCVECELGLRRRPSTRTWSSFFPKSRIRTGAR